MTGSPASSATTLPTADALRRAAQRALARCDELALCTERAGEITRTFCSPAMRDAQRRVESWMQAAGLQVHFDPATNLIGRRAGQSGTSLRDVNHLAERGATLLIGSHLDSVVNAGRYDGVLGVMLGLAVVELLGEAGVELPFALDVIGFCEEEGVRFSTPYIGSRALLGELTPELLARRDAGGCTMGDALRAFGGDPDRLADARYDPERVVAYLEPHIEQGPVLEIEGLPVAVVTGIAGQTRASWRFQGRAGHAGTSPMRTRRDALVAAAQWIAEVESIALRRAGLVATVGRIEVTPNVGNVIPSEVRLRLDLRHLEDEVRQSAFLKIVETAAAICEQRGIEQCLEWVEQEPSVKCDRLCLMRIEQAITEAGWRPFSMPSGAGHDAGMMSKHFRACMLFVRCAGGVSHHPDEAVSEADVTAALDVLWRFLLKLADAKTR